MDVQIDARMMPTYFFIWINSEWIKNNIKATRPAPPLRDIDLPSAYALSIGAANNVTDAASVWVDVSDESVGLIVDDLLQGNI